jgi:hypothetical protein
MKKCNKECEHCQPYNQDWCICWHKNIKGSTVQMNIQCTVEKLQSK